MIDSSKVKWPKLKKIGHVKGRLATEEDRQAGNAVFVLPLVERKSGATPLDIDIPQYAIHLNNKTAEKTPGVIIQAEETTQGQKVAGFISAGSNKSFAAQLHEFILLGKEPLKKF